MSGDHHDDPNEMLRAIHCPDLAEKLAAFMRAQDEDLANARGLVAELLALNPSVSGDMEKVRVFADVIRQMQEFAGGIDDQ